MHVMKQERGEKLGLRFGSENADLFAVSEAVTALFAKHVVSGEAIDITKVGVIPYVTKASSGNGKCIFLRTEKEQTDANLKALLKDRKDVRMAAFWSVEGGEPFVKFIPGYKGIETTLSLYVVATQYGYNLVRSLPVATV